MFTFRVGLSAEGLGAQSVLPLVVSLDAEVDLPRHILHPHVHVCGVLDLGEGHGACLRLAVA